MFTRTSVILERKVWYQQYQHARVWFIYAKCDFDTHTCQKHTLRVEITLVCDVHTYTVMNSRTSVISESKVWFQHARVWFIYVESDFSTQSVTSTRRVWFLHAECDCHTHRVWFLHAECNCYTQSVISKRSVIFTRTNMITTLTNVISTRTNVIYTRRVRCWHVWVWLCIHALFGDTSNG
jgi:hypothetical protein